MSGPGVALRRATLFLTVAYAVGMAALIVMSADADSAGGGWFVFLVFLWNIGPVVVACAIARLGPAFARVMLAFVIGFILCATGAFVAAFVVNPDPQSPLVFLWFPAFGWVALAVAGIGAALRARLRRP